ncbi:MAG: hypothetical protein WDN29_03215 [Methylovirgula sp.]
MKWRVANLNRWQLVGIVVSILWFLGSFVYLWNSAVNSYKRDVVYFATSCKLLRFDSENACLVMARQFSFRPSRGLAILDIIISAAPIVFAWCGAWAGALIFKWMQAGPEDESIT